MRHRVEHLAAEALGDDAGADALAGRVDRGRRRRPGPPPTTSTSNGSLASIGRGGALGAARVELGDDLLEGHAALVEQLAVEEHGRHGHHLARVDLVLEQRAVDRDVGDVRVEHAHEVERLHHVGAVLARRARSRSRTRSRRRGPGSAGSPRATAVEGWPPTCSSAEHQRGELVAAAGCRRSAPRRRCRRGGWRTTGGGRRRRRRSTRDVRRTARRARSSSSASSADLGLSSSEATSSIGRVIFSKWVCSCAVRAASSIGAPAGAAGGECRERGRRAGSEGPRDGPAIGGGAGRRAGPRDRRGSDLADEVERRGEGVVALFPLGRADLVRVRPRRTARP